MQFISKLGGGDDGKRKVEISRRPILTHCNMPNTPDCIPQTVFALEPWPKTQFCKSTLMYTVVYISLWSIPNVAAILESITELFRHLILRSHRIGAHISFYV